MNSNSNYYKYITINDKVIDVINNPAFKGFGFHLFPWNDRRRYSPNMTMREAASLNLWHTNLNPEEEVDGLNRLIDDINKGYKVFYDIYTEHEKQADPYKKYTGLFFIRGKKNAPYMIMLPGGGFFYVGTLHEGLPVIKEINKYGYNTFVLKYRVDTGGTYAYDYENKAAKDLIRAVHFIENNYQELGVSKDNYSLWGGSAGARTVGCAVYGEGGITKKECLRPALAVIAYVFFEEYINFDKNESPAFFIVGKNDALVPWTKVKERADIMKKAGCIVEDYYIKFWEKNMKG